ncbi:MAG: hypothetical protein DRP81_08925 [Candidatus Omnitrophota bacterium]|nr:MAG: hypothetical protein DRP81_08925 [Candidatus Omnitrophota bacterium]
MNPVLLIVIPLGFAFFIPLLGFISRKAEKFIPSLALLVNIILSLSLLPSVMRKPIIVLLGGFLPPFCINLFVGPVGVIFSLIIAIVGFLVSIYAWSYIGGDGKREEKYHMLYLLLLAGATGVVLTGDIFNLFVFYEILCISSYALVAYLGEKAGVESASKYLIQGSVGSTLILIAIGLLYGQFGTLNMADIAQNINTINPLHLFIPLVLFLTGLGVEAAIFPLNAWLPDAHSSAPSTISAILSGIAIKIGIYAMARVVFTIFGAYQILLFLILLGVITLLVGELSAFSQNNIKRMLAYSSIGQMGLILLALSIGTVEGISSGLFQIFTHAFSKSLLFLAAGYMIYQAGSLKISSLEGMGKKMPLSSLAFSIGAFSLIGLPPFMGFGSKFMIIRSLLEKGNSLFTTLAGIVLVGTVIEGAYFFKVIQRLYFKETAESEGGVKEAPVGALLPMIFLVMLIISIGVYPKMITGILNSCAGELLNRLEYIKAVFGG